MDDVMAAIKKEQEHPDLCAWAQETLKYLTSMSPTSLTIALEGLHRGRCQSIAQCFQMEFHLLQKFLVNHDMHEGVYKTLVYRGQTSQWQPPTLTDIDRDAILQKYFEAPSPWPTLSMVATKDFMQYPYRQYSLPTEQDIKDVVMKQHWSSPDQVVDHFVDQRHGKQGVKQKVAEILAGRTRRQDATLVWID
jgi:3-hydroxyisobutyryl-CoA hydrolase